MSINIKDLNISTLNITIQCIRVDNKALTKAVFDQIKIRKVFDTVGNGERFEDDETDGISIVLNGKILGYVMQKPKSIYDIVYDKWILWSNNIELFKFEFVDYRYIKWFFSKEYGDYGDKFEKRELPEFIKIIKSLTQLYIAV